MIGRFDPETNQIVPTRKRVKASQQLSSAESPLVDTGKEVQLLSDEIIILRVQFKQLEHHLSLLNQKKDNEHQKLMTLVNQLNRVLSIYS